MVGARPANVSAAGCCRAKIAKDGPPTIPGVSTLVRGCSRVQAVAPSEAALPANLPAGPRSGQPPCRVAFSHQRRRSQAGVLHLLGQPPD